ncbi:uncharacterized protein BXZ73DRAFT_81328 [Epithele typhae]|uniref:uncharacterized protein n=1 Tax=Epithele typhae TaxID=378194 RepID=UPI00200771D9|nr:uncharacterized protein BXZ73DRAFT_81328 [Epithele typhae]KAH9915429.1 hypothetical protein BXZ73DRAFT_81328 [Epithele typhae]
MASDAANQAASQGSAASAPPLVDLSSPRKGGPYASRSLANTDIDVQPTARIARGLMLERSSKCTTPLTLDEFMRTLMPEFDEGDFNKAFSAKDIKSIGGRFHRRLKNKDHTDKLNVVEKDVSAAWANVNKSRPLCPGSVFGLSENYPDVGEPTGSKCDGHFIHERDQHSIKEKRPNWDYHRFTVEFKRGGTQNDPWDDDKTYNPESTAVSRKVVRGQLSSYADLVFKHQHRLFHFMLLVNSARFRILRWDRSRIAVSEATDYAKGVRGTRQLFRVLYALSIMTDKQAGYDPSAFRLEPGSCGWERMSHLGDPTKHASDVDHAERFDFADPDKTTYPENLYHPQDASHHSLFDTGGIYSDPRAKVTSNAPWADCVDLPTFQYIRAKFKASISGDRPRYMFTIKGRYYLVGFAEFAAVGPIGRGTRGFPALEWHTQQFVWVKDCWHPFYANTAVEGDILKELNEDGIENVPTLVAYEDYEGEHQVTWVSEHSDHLQAEAASTSTTERPKAPLPTRSRPPHSPSPAPKPHVYKQAQPAQPSTSSSAQGPSVPSLAASSGQSGVKRLHGQDEAKTSTLVEPPDYVPGPRHMRHCRLVVAEVCLKLSTFESSQQLVQTIYWAFRAHAQAYDVSKVLHRDVSAGNILMYPRIFHAEGKTACWSRGILGDWEMAKKITVSDVSQPERTGTWPYMSVMCQDDASLGPKVGDEVESFLHVVAHQGLRFVNHNWSKVDVHQFCLQYFESHAGNRSNMRSSPFKKECIRKGVLNHPTGILGRLEFTAVGDDGGAAVHPLNELVQLLLNLCSARFAVHLYEVELAEYKSAVSRPAAQVASQTTQSISLFNPIRRVVAAAATAPVPKLPSNPGEPVETDAALLDDHAHVLDMLEGFAYPPLTETGAPMRTWPANDRSAEDALIGYDPYAGFPLPVAAGLKRTLVKARKTSQGQSAGAAHSRSSD